MKSWRRRRGGRPGALSEEERARRRRRERGREAGVVRESSAPATSATTVRVREQTRYGRAVRRGEGGPRRLLRRARRSTGARLGRVDPGGRHGASCVLTATRGERSRSVRASDLRHRRRQSPGTPTARRRRAGCARSTPPWYDLSRRWASRSDTDELRAEPRRDARSRVRDGDTRVTDGPFAETKEQLGGYYLIDCRSLDEAIEWAARIPARAHGTVEVRPLVMRHAEVADRRRRSPRLPGGVRARPSPILARVLGDFELAEDAVQDAFATALERWPRDGVPANPGAWIVTTARNRAIDRLRRDRDARPEDRAARAAARSLPARRTRRADDPGRAPRADLHLLPPRARARGAGRPDAAHASAASRRPRSRAPSSSPSRRSRSGSCARSARSATPAFPSRVPRRPPPARPAAGRAGRRSTSSSTRATRPRRATRSSADELCDEAIRLAKLLAVLDAGRARGARACSR